MASSAKGTLLRILRNDSPDPDQYVLLHIAPTSSSQLLNLQIHATEGERAFETKMKQSKISDFRAKSYTGPAEELERILSVLLLKTSVSEPHLLPRGVELAASVDKNCVTLTVRQNIGGIKQRIAAIKIPEAEVDIPIFEWAVESCGVLDSTSAQVESLQSRVSLQESEIAKLANQLQSLVVLKKEHEETLLAKFSELLNSKKSKIRDLNRALGTASSNVAIPEPAPEVDIKEESPPPATAAPSKKRATRAKAAPKTTARKRKLVAPPSDSESDGFVKMDVDTKGKGVSETPADGDETEDSEDFGVGEKRSDYLRQNELGQSDRSAAEDEDELPPVRRPFEAFTLRAPDKRTPEPETEDAEVEAEPKTAARGGRGSRAKARGRGKGKASAPTASSPSPPPAPTRGRGRGRMATRSKPPPPKGPSPSPPEDTRTGEEDTDDDDEL